MSQPILKPLHARTSLVESKLDYFRRLASESLIDSLKPGTPGSLKTRDDGTMLDGHHRIEVLRERGIDVDRLSREVMPREEAD